jgi:hypothetical protein
MTAVDDLAALQQQVAKINPDTAAQELAELLRLPDVGLGIVGARIVGRGAGASADIYLSNGGVIEFESLRDVATPKAVAVEIAAATGASPGLKAPQAIQAVVLLRAIAKHYSSMSADHFAAEWGSTFLQKAATQDVDMNDQADRWRAFYSLRGVEPSVSAQQQGIPVASACVVLVHTSGTRYVRTGWFRAHAKTEDSTISPAEIARRMLRVGWRQSGTDGRIKASCPGRPESLVWTFYAVEPGWEQDQ